MSLRDFGVLLVLPVLFFLTGCETTDYEPLVFKQKMKDLETRMAEVESAASSRPVETADPAASSKFDSTRRGCDLRGGRDDRAGSSTRGS